MGCGVLAPIKSATVQKLHKMIPKNKMNFCRNFLCKKVEIIVLI